MSIYPMVMLVRMSFSNVTIANILHGWPWVGLANYQAVFETGSFRAVVAQTLVFVVAVLAATMVAGLIFALVLRDSKGFSLVTQTTLILVWTLPLVIVGSLWKFLLASSGAVNRMLVALHLVNAPVPFLAQPITALGAVALVSIWVGLPFAAMVMKSAILDVPEDVLEAARLDGANERKMITYIVLPMIRPTMLTLGVLTVVGAFRAFDLVYVMTKGGPGTSSSTIPFYGYTQAFQQYQFGQAGAISVVAMLIVLGLAVAYIFAVRQEKK